jgi:two-component sensor histidine kinase
MHETVLVNTGPPAIIDSVGASLLILDENLGVISTNRAYRKTFKLKSAQVKGRRIYDLGGGEWNIPDLRERLEAVVPRRRPLEAYEVEGEFSGLGRRTMRLDASEMALDPNGPAALLVSIIDITAMRGVERDLVKVVQRKEILLEEMSHRIANSLMIMASILLLRAKLTTHEETKRSLQDAHHRVLSIAAVQQQLRTLAETDAVDLTKYLTDLCQRLAASMTNDHPKISLTVRVEAEKVGSDHAVHIGLIATELVINALKHAFPEEDRGGEIVVAYKGTPARWALTVSDDGIGGLAEQKKAGLGTIIINALASQMDAGVTVSIPPRGGRCVAVTHADAKAGRLLSENRAEPLAAGEPE